MHVRRGLEKCDFPVFVFRGAFNLSCFNGHNNLHDSFQSCEMVQVDDAVQTLAYLAN